jgi:hypothetical protein
MPDEKYYVGTLLELDEALSRLQGFEAHITAISYSHWRRTVEIEQEILSGEADNRHRSRHHSGRRATAAEGSNSNSEPRARVDN